MNLLYVRKLHPGDQVKWNDPDDGKCSCVITIECIEINGDVCRIWADDGEYIECLAEELS